jgi:hypothetical protein
MEKIFNHKVFITLFGHLWEVELTYRYIFAFKFTLRLSSLILFPLFATGAVPLTPAANLPPVSTTRAKLVAKFASPRIFEKI